MIQRQQLIQAPVVTLVLWFYLASLNARSIAQTEPLYKQERFDQLILTEAHENQVVEVYSLAVKRRPRVPRGPDEQKLRVRLVSHPDREYDIAWKDIQGIRLFEQMILEKADRLVSANKLDEAFWHLETLRRMDANWPGLDSATLRYLKADVAASFQAGHLVQALAILAEIQRMAPANPAGSRGTFKVVQRLFDARFDQGDFVGARGIINWAAQPANPLELGAWIEGARSKLERQADQLVGEAEAQFAQGDYRAARMLLETAREASPTNQDARALSRQIRSRHPQVVVGVTRTANPARLGARHDWASRRLTRLIRRELVEVVGYGKYVCPYGNLNVYADDRGALIQLTPSTTSHPQAITGYDIARTLLELPTNGGYASELAHRLFASVQVENVFEVRVDFTRPLLEPRGLFLMPLSPHIKTPAAYRLVSSTPTGLECERTESSVESRVESFELVERHFSSASAMIKALKRREITVIDRLSPLQAQQIDQELGLTTQRYRFPSQHFLIPNHDRPLMANRMARRAICYAIARQAILQQDLLGGQQIEGCRLLSGPFTLGLFPDDSVAYAINEQVRPRVYNPSLAITLYTLAQHSLAQHQAGEGASEPQKWAPLKLVHADDALMASTAATMSRYLVDAGIKCQVEVLPPGTGRPEGDWDLWYADVVMMVPLLDIHWLIGPQGMARGASPYLESALRQLEEVTSWTDARHLLDEVHRLVNDELVLIPLWQLTNHLAHRNELSGITEEPATLYQNVESWRLQ